MPALLRLRSLSRFVMTGFTASLLSASLFAAEAAAPAPAASADGAPAGPAPAAPVLLANLTQKVEGIFAYGTWQGKLATQPDGGMVIQGSKGAQGSGGFGHELKPIVDLSKRDYIEVGLATRENNEVPQYAVGFNDEDGTLVTARVRVDQLMPNQSVWLRVKLSDFSVVSGQGGKDSKMDWTKVAKWHLQGDYGTAKPARVMFIALRAR